MNFTQSFKLALKSLKTSKMRAFLTMLGIIIGVGAVIVILSLGNGMTNMMNSQFEKMGSNLIQVMTYGRGTGGTRDVDVEDLYELVDKYPQYLTGVTPYVSASAKVRYQTDDYARTSVYGVSEAFFKEDTKGTMQGETLAEGRFLSYIDVDRHQNVCVIGDYLNRVGYGGNGLGQTLKIGADKFRIVGVLAPKVSNAEMQQGSDDDCVYLPYTTVMRLTSQSSVRNYTAIMMDESRADEAKTAVENQLKELLGTEDGYYVYSASEWLEEMNNMINMVIVVLTGIASISLLVGGIGIMNIMLVSVTERTREIGIRKALGAKERTILSQFVVEAATTSALGGVLGIALGYAVSMAANKLLPMFTSGTDITVSPSFNSIAVAFGISVGIGVLFGYLPARRAARLNPIEALRYD